MTSRPVRAFAMVTVLLLAGAGISVRAEDAPRMPISRDCILRALHSSGVSILPEQMEELSGMTAAEPNPPLKVLSVDMLDADSDKVLLRCEHPNTCLPFYVLVNWGRLEDGSAARPGRPDNKAAQSDRQAVNPLVRSGRTVVLMLEGEYIHMTLPVLCLQNGGRGQQVRVISKETKKRYVARVTGPGVVTSALSE
ncbi:MAG: flagella basal body P-ring formation protein FlgA [Terriglobales bacterium]